MCKVYFSYKKNIKYIDDIKWTWSTGWVKLLTEGHFTLITPENW